MNFVAGFEFARARSA